MYADGVKRGDKAQAAADAKTAKTDIDRAQQALVRDLQSNRIGAEILGRTQRVFNGISARVDRTKLDDIAACLP